MSCPACGCKVAYQYDGEGCELYGYELQRCAGCGNVFGIDDSIEDDDDDTDDGRW